VGRLDGWKFCPRCAASLLHDDGSVRCTACGYVEWGSSVPGAQALIERDGQVLLGRRAFEPGLGRWDIPGGFLEEGEHPVAALRREIREETGLEIEPLKFFGVWMQPYWHRNVLCLTWVACPTGGSERPGDDLVELRWFARDELPAPDELAFDSFVEILSRWRSEHA
jgi:ADP-ribose pyrophosphatase YjhB (NUDIX family)